MIKTRDFTIPTVSAYLRVLSRRYEVETAETGRGALQVLGVFGFDAVVCDLHLGDMHGRSVFDAATRARPELKRRFIFSSGGSADHDDVAFLATVPSISKPCTTGALAELIDQVVGGR